MNQVCELGDEHYVTPAATLSTKTVDGDLGESGNGGKCEIYDGAFDLVYELPQSAAGFALRLREQIAKAAAKAIEAEGGRIAPDRLENLYCDAAECVQADVSQMVSELAEDADGESVTLFS